MRMDGYSMSEIAVSLSLPRSSVQRVLGSRGVKAPPMRAGRGALAKQSGTDSFVYLAICPHMPGLVKIGVAKDLDKRLGQMRVSNPFMCFCYTCRGSFALESRLHYEFASQRVAGEWFRVDVADIVQKIKVISANEP